MIRYSRHIVMPQVGQRRPRRLLDARVLLLVGAGGLGSPGGALIWQAAGVGVLGILDDDVVDLSNSAAAGAAPHGGYWAGPRLLRRRTRCTRSTRMSEVISHPLRLTSHNALSILGNYDLVLNCSDNFPTRYLVNDACVLLGKPLVDGSILQFDGQMSVFYPAAAARVYRCLFPAPPRPGDVPSCAEAGGLSGVLPGIIGSLRRWRHQAHCGRWHADESAGC